MKALRYKKVLILKGKSHHGQVGIVSKQLSVDLHVNFSRHVFGEWSRKRQGSGVRLSCVGKQVKTS